jgi:membrane protein
MKYLRVFKDFEWERIFDGSAALTYYFILAIFPGLLVTLSVISYIPPEIITSDNLYWVIRQTPKPVSELILNVVKNVSGENQFGMFSISFLIAIWTVSNGVSAAIRQLNLSYKANEERGYIKLQLTSILLSFAVGILVLTPILASFLLKFAISYFPSTSYISVSFLNEIFNIKYFLFLFLFFLLFQTIYHFGPSVSWSWKKHLPGSVSMSIAFVLVTQIFEIYLAKFADYSLIYGSVGTIVILMLWFNILGLLLIIGGEINTKIDFDKHFGDINQDLQNILKH